MSSRIITAEIFDAFLTAGNALSKRGAGLKQQEPNRSTS
jgi:hypothetical protein